MEWLTCFLMVVWGLAPQASKRQVHNETTPRPRWSSEVSAKAVAQWRVELTSSKQTDEPARQQVTLLTAFWQSNAGLVITGWKRSGLPSSGVNPSRTAVAHWLSTSGEREKTKRSEKGIDNTRCPKTPVTSEYSEKASPTPVKRHHWAAPRHNAHARVNRGLIWATFCASCSHSVVRTSLRRRPPNCGASSRAWSSEPAEGHACFSTKLLMRREHTTGCCLCHFGEFLSISPLCWPTPTLTTDLVGRKTSPRGKGEDLPILPLRCVRLWHGQALNHHVPAEAQEPAHQEQQWLVISTHSCVGG